MLLCSDSSSEDDGTMNLTGLERHREALAAGLPEWDDNQSHSSSNSSINQPDLFNKFGSQSFRRGRCGSPHPRQMYSTRKSSSNASSLLIYKNLPSPPQPTSPTADGPLSMTQHKGATSANVNNSNSQGAKSSKIKIGIGKQGHQSGQRGQNYHHSGPLQNGHAESTELMSKPRFVPKSSPQGTQGPVQQIVRVQVQQAAVTKLERTKPLDGMFVFMVITTRQRSYGKVMFSVSSVRHSVWGGGGVDWSSVTITHVAVEITIQGPHCAGTLNYPTPETCSDLFNLDLIVQRPWPWPLHPSRPSWTCSNVFIIKHVRFASRRFAS